MLLPASVADTVHRRSLIMPNDTVLVAVSGGPDSIALLHCLVQLGYQTEAAHLNHQFRGQESDDDAKFVREFCRALSVKVTVESVDVPNLRAQQRVSAQQAARAARYTFLESVRAHRKLDRIATAHNFDDRIETVLINILRGTGIDGLRGIPYRRANIVRPLLDTSRAAVEAYCELHNLSPRADSSNNLTKYARNNVRSELLPYLERRYNVAVRQSIFRLSELAGDESDYFNQIAEEWIGKHAKIAVARLVSEPPALQRRILRAWIRRQTTTELSDVTHELIEQFRVRANTSCAVTLPGARIVVQSDGVEIWLRSLPVSVDTASVAFPIALNQVAMFGDYLVSVLFVPESVDSPSLHLRSWEDGDRIILKSGTKKVQDVFTDRKVPRDARRRYPLLADRDGLVAVGNIAVAARAAGMSITIATVD